jgi:hypothetical protein
VSDEDDESPAASTALSEEDNKIPSIIDVDSCIVAVIKEEDEVAGLAAGNTRMRKTARQYPPRVISLRTPKRKNIQRTTSATYLCQLVLSLTRISPFLCLHRIRFLGP